MSRSEAKLYCLQIISTDPRPFARPDARPSGLMDSGRVSTLLHALGRNGSSTYIAVGSDDELYSWMDELNKVGSSEPDPCCGPVPPVLTA